MKYARIYSTAEGESRVEAVDVAVTPVEFVPGEPTVDLSSSSEVSRLMFVRLAPGWPGGWHPTPRRQFVVGISGAAEFQTTDGTAYLLQPGDVLLLEDTSGKGHHTRVAGETEWWGLLIALRS